MALPPAGYCKHCNWLIPLDHRGKLERHDPNPLRMPPRTCPGSCTRPPADPPTEVPELAFNENPPTVVCPVCGQEVLSRYPSPPLSPSTHARPDSSWGEICIGSYGMAAPAA